MIRCRTCVMPATRPDTPFIDGECSACANFSQRGVIDWPQRKIELTALLERFEGKCIVPSSGGKDSTAQALMLKELGAEVTAVTATTCHLTEAGRRNIDSLAREVRTIEITPNTRVRAKLNRLALQMVGDPSWPEHVSIHRTPFKIAADIGVPLVFYGELPTREYGGPPGSYDTRTMTQRWVSEFGGFLGLRADDFVGIDGISEADMSDYQAPNPEKIVAAGVEAHFLGQYLPWNSHANASRAVASGLSGDKPCAANYWPFENLDNAQCGIHDHMMYRKFGYGRGCAQISVDVRGFLIDRDRAMNWVRHHDGLFPEFYAGVHVEDVAQRLSLTRAQLVATMDKFTSWNLFDRVEHGRPILREFA